MRDGRLRSRDAESQDVNVRRLDDDVIDLINEIADSQGFIRDRAGVINVTHLEGSVGVALQGWNLFTAAEQAIDGPSLYSSDDPDGTYRPELPRRWFPVAEGSLLQFVWRGAWENELDGEGNPVDPVSALRLLRRDGFEGTVETADEFPLKGRRAVIPSSRPYRGGFQFAFELVGTGNHEAEVRPVITALGTTGQQTPTPADETPEITNWSQQFTGDTTVTVSKPADVEEGDLIFGALFSQARLTNLVVPSGWTIVRRDGDTGSSVRPTIYSVYKVAGASEPASYDFSWDGPSPTNSYMFLMRTINAVESDVTDGASGANSGASAVSELTAPSFALTHPEPVLIVQLAVWRASDPQIVFSSGETLFSREGQSAYIQDAFGQHLLTGASESGPHTAVCTGTCGTGTADPDGAVVQAVAVKGKTI